MRSAKQRANDRRLGRMAKKRFSAKRKTLKRRTTKTKPMARRRSMRRRARTSVRRIATRRTGSKIVSTVKPMASGIGGGILTETVANRVGMGQYGQLAGFGGAYLFGGVKGVLGKLGFDLITGRGVSFFGGQNTSNSVGMSI